MVAAAKPEHERTAWERFCKDVIRDKWLYLLLLPGIVFLIIFRYIPIFGNVIAFMDYNPYDASQNVWVGLKHFQDLLTRPQFLQVFGNTLYISILKMVCGFPIPIILALMMNEMKNLKFKKVAQTLLYLPNFISWVVLAGLIMNMLDPDTGLVTSIINSISGEKIQVLTDTRYFVPMLIITDIYKGAAGARSSTLRRCPASTRSSMRRPRSTVRASGSSCSTSPCRPSPRRSLSC